MTTSAPRSRQAELLGLVVTLAEAGAADDPAASLGPVTALPATRLARLVDDDTTLPGPALPAGVVDAARLGVQRVVEADAAVDDDLRLNLLEVVDLLGAGGPDAPSEPPPPALLVPARGLVVPCVRPDDPDLAGHPWLRALDTAALQERVGAAVRGALAEFPAQPRRTADPVAAWAVLWPFAEPPDADPLGVPLALAAIAAACGLPARERPLVAVGSLGDSGRAVPLDDAVLADLLARGGWGDVDVLLPGRRGWVLRTADGATREGPLAALTWGAAGDLAWGEAWREWRRNAHEAELAALGWQVVPAGTASTGPLPDTDVHESSALRLLVDSRPRALVLGGTARSGKSTIVRVVTSRLLEAGEKNRRRERERREAGRELPRKASPPSIWDVVVVRSTSHELPDREVLLQVGRHALATGGTPDANRRLLVLEDLYPTGDGNVDDVLPYLVNRLGANVLAVLEYDSNAHREWKTDRVGVVPAVVGVEALKVFVETLATKHPMATDRDAGLAALQEDPPVRDLCRLVALMTRPGRPTGRQAIDAEVEARARQLIPQELEQVAAVAAASLVRIPTSEADVAGLADDVRVDFGMTRDPADGYRIRDGETCRAVLRVWQAQRVAAVVPDAAPDRQVPVTDVMADLLHRHFLGPLLESAAPELVPRLATIRLHSDRLCRELLSRASPEIDGWLEASSADTAARLATSLDTVVGEPLIRAVLRRISDEALQRTPLASVDAALAVVRCLHRHLSFLAPGSFERLLSWLGRQAERLLEQGSGADGQRLALLQSLERLHDPALNTSVANLVVTVFDELDPGSVESYYLVQRVIALQKRAKRFVDPDRTQVFDVDQETAVQGLLNHAVDQSTPFEVVVGQMMLRREYRLAEWDTLLDEHLPMFPATLRLSSPHTFAEALNRLRVTNPFYPSALLKRALATDRHGFVAAVRQLLQQATTNEAAAVIQALATCHSGTARDVLYDGDRPDRNLLKHLTRSDVLPRDAKGVGMLLSAIHVVDQVYATREPFGAALADAVGKDWVLRTLAKDPRPSVKYYLMKGIWDAEIAFRRECLSTAAQVVAQDMQTSSTVWAAQLALRISQDPGMGDEFLDLLRAGLTTDQVLRCMRSMPTEALTQHHRLGRLLYPEVAERYAAGFSAADLADLVGAGRGAAVAECCREVARTLADAGVADAGPDLLVALAGGRNAEQQWADRLAGAGNGDEFVQILAVLQDVDADLARRALGRLARRVRPSEDQPDDPDRVLSLLVRRAMFDDAPSAAGMLAGIHQVAGTGKQVYRDIQERYTFAMTVFTSELRMVQEPAQVYRVARAMASIGVRRGDDWDEWTDPRVKKILLPQFRGPRPILDTLKTLTLWSAPDAQEAAEQLDLHHLTLRLQRGAAGDVDPAVRLAAFLWQSGSGGPALQVLDAVATQPPDWLAEQLSPDTMLQLLKLCRIRRPRLLQDVAPRLGAETLDRVDRRPVQDAAGALAWAGHVAYALSGAGFPIEADVAPGGLLTSGRALHRPGPLAWCLRWLPASSRLRETYAAALERLYESPESCAAAPFAALAVAASKGESRGVPLPEAALERMSLRELLVLHELAPADPHLAGLLAELRPALETRLRGPLAAIDFTAWELSESLRPGPARQSIS